MYDFYTQQVTLLIRSNLIAIVNASLTETDKEFLLSFEAGVPDWAKCCAGNLSIYPSVKWKLQNILDLKRRNPQKHKNGCEKLQIFFYLNLLFTIFMIKSLRLARNQYV